MPKRIEYNVQTGKRTEIELTQTELAQAAIDKAAWDIEYARRESEEQRKRDREAAIDRLILERGSR